MWSLPTSRRTPQASSLAMSAPRWAGLQQSTLRSPPVMAPAMRKVPASMRSGLMRWRAPWSLATPWTWMVEVPAPLIFAPMALSRAARSETSGSRAQFSKRVSPSARAAAMRRSSVPVTVILSKTMCAPLRRELPLLGVRASR